MTDRITEDELADLHKLAEIEFKAGTAWQCALVLPEKVLALVEEIRRLREENERLHNERDYYKGEVLARERP